MYKILGVFIATAALISCALGNVITGHFTWLSGTLVLAVTGKQAAQTVYIKVGTTTHTLTNTIVTGTTSYPAGTPFSALETGSQPFAANFSAFSAQVQPSDGSGSLGIRLIPTNATGVFTANLAFPNSGSLAISLPEATIGTLSFRNGITCSFDVNSPNYSFTIPTSTVPTAGSMIFPAGALGTTHTFSFSATGTGLLTMAGSGLPDTLWVAGTMFFAGSIFTDVTLDIHTNSPF